ncbi:MAG: hypothetical protein IPP48_15730 [Chitinophagaceae bacterium]|nr:hypothetical protein [Chitinophagaceae bacterium]
MTATQMNAIASPPNGLLVFNNSANSIYQYNQPAAQWKPIVADSSEWFYDSATTKLFFRRALANQDSLYYNTGTKKWIFADSRLYTTSTGGVFNLDEGNSDRFIFKTTASKYLRPYPNLNSANLYAIYSVDNDTLALSHPFEASYFGLASDVTVTPQATQRISELYGMRSFATSAARDSVSATYGLLTLSTIRGKGYHDVVYGINNAVSIRDSATTIGLVVGIQNRLNYTSPLGTPRVNGDVYGYLSSMSTAFNNKVDGSAYGIFLGNVTAAGPNRNYGIYTSRGANRFGDSVLVTDIFANRPRAVLDINSTSAMILPAGTTAQRPATLYTGMLRYNTDNATPEAYTGSAWVNLKNPVLSTTAILDPPSIATNSTGTVTYTLTGAAFGNTVTISPDVALPAGYFIAWARVSAVNQIQIAFGNISGLAIDLTAQNFYIKLVQ